MPSFFIIAFIWRGLIFPGSIFLDSLPYSYGYSIIKCNHLRTRNDRCTAGNEAIVRRNDHHVVARADLRVGSDNVLGKHVLPFRDELRHILPDDNTVTGSGKVFLEALCTLDTERQPAVRGADCCEPYPFKEDLAYPPRCRELERASFGEESCARIAAKLVVSNRLDAPD
jgi:hypothetical protein